MSVIPCSSQAPKEANKPWTSTKSTCSKSNAIFGPQFLISFSNSGRCSACIRPISRIFVPEPSEYVSIFNVSYSTCRTVHVVTQCNPSASS